MRHFLNNIAAFIENNENDNALAHKRYAHCNRKRAWAWYKSIRQTAERLGGKCQYSVSDTMFIVRVII